MASSSNESYFYKQTITENFQQNTLLRQLLFPVKTSFPGLEVFIPQLDARAANRSGSSPLSIRLGADPLFSLGASFPSATSYSSPSHC